MTLPGLQHIALARIVSRRRVSLLLATLLVCTLAPRLDAQRRRLRFTPRPAWTLSLIGGGSYALSDIEIVPGTDQNGGWGFDVGLRFGRGQTSLGLGFERFRFDLTPGSDGSATASGIFAEPRIALGRTGAGVEPFLFGRASRIFDYDPSVCCSVYDASENARGWRVGGGFGVAFPATQYLRLDLSAGVYRLSGKSQGGAPDPWEAAGPVADFRLGATLPIAGRGFRD